MPYTLLQGNGLTPSEMEIKMEKVVVNGTEFETAAVVNLMDDEIREDLSNKGFETEKFGQRMRPMTPADFRAARESLCLSRAQLAAAFGIEGARPQAGIEDWEAGRRAIPPTAAMLMGAIVLFGLPDQWPDKSPPE